MLHILCVNAFFLLPCICVKKAGNSQKCNENFVKSNLKSRDKLLNVAFYQIVWWGSKKCAKSENFNFPSISISVNNLFKFSAENSDLAHFLSCMELSDKNQSLSNSESVSIDDDVIFFLVIELRLKWVR